MAKKLTISLFVALLILSSARGFAQQEPNCDPVCVVTTAGDNSISVAQLAAIKGPKLTFPNCDTVREGMFIRRYTLYCLRESEMLWVKTLYGKNPAFDKATSDVLRTLNTGDTLCIKDIIAGSKGVDELLPPLKFWVDGDGTREKKASKNEDGALVVTRVISIPAPTDTSRKKGGTSAKDTILASLLLEKVKNGSLKVYPALNFEATSPLGQAAINSILSPVPDTFIVEDVDGTLIRKIVKNHFDYSAVCSFKVLEEWNPGEENDEDKIQVLGIAPIYDYYDIEGNLWAHRPLFWIKYEDAAEIIDSFDTSHPKNNFMKAVWKDFKKGKKTNSTASPEAQE